jgi:hypothetical protein
MRTFSVYSNSEAATSDCDALKRLYSDVQHLRTLLGVLKCGSAAGPSSVTAIGNLNPGHTVH